MSKYSTIWKITCSLDVTNVASNISTIDTYLHYVHVLLMYADALKGYAVGTVGGSFFSLKEL